MKLAGMAWEGERCGEGRFREGPPVEEDEEEAAGRLTGEKGTISLSVDRARVSRETVGLTSAEGLDRMRTVAPLEEAPFRPFGVGLNGESASPS